MHVSAPLLGDHAEIVPVPNQHGVRHRQEQPRPDNARNGSDITFQLSWVLNRPDLAIENVVAVVRYIELTRLKVRGGPAAKIAQPSLAQRQGKRQNLNRQFSARSQLRN